MLRTALVTGGNRGIGLEVCRQLATKGLRVILTARNRALGEKAAVALSAGGLDVRSEELDLASAASVQSCAARLSSAGIRVDVLVNNGAVYPEGDALGVSDEDFLDAVNVNLAGAWRTCRSFAPSMIRAGYGRIVNVSSGYGSFAEGLEGPAAYSITKAALNALTLKFAQVADGRHVKVNAACPGWVRTRMGGRGAELSVEEGADTIVWLAMLPPDGPNGTFFRDRQPIPW